MALTPEAATLLERAAAILPDSDADLIVKGVTTATSERIVQLKKVTASLHQKYGSVEALEEKIAEKGVSPDDHSLYTELLEWRAAQEELAQLLALLQAM